MNSTLEYNYRTRGNADEMCFGKGERREEPDYDRFSLPPKSHADAGAYTTIKRPEIPQMSDFVERYL